MLGNQSTESNGYVRILTGSSEVAGSAHAQYNLAKKNSREQLAQRREASKVQCIAIASCSIVSWAM